MPPSDDGGPAFAQVRSTFSDGSPAAIQDSCSKITTSGGMSLRDYFAGQALVACVTIGERLNVSTTSIVRNAYAIADAMIAERKKETAK